MGAIFCRSNGPNAKETVSVVRRAFQITLDESRTFARLSGDWNPLHVDPVVARRLMFGSTVVHGVDILLRTLDEVFRQNGSGAIAKLNVTFASPLRTGAAATIESSEEVGDDPSTIVFKVMSEGRLVQRVALTIGNARASEPAPVFCAAAAPAQPEAHDFNALSEASGSVPLVLDPDVAKRLYPELCRNLPPSQLAVLLATTRIVGMKCPGLHSVYTELSLAFSSSNENSGNRLNYRVTKADQRFKFLMIAIEGGGASGQIGALVRPAPVEQNPFVAVSARVRNDAFRDRRAVVIGGSRGLGEVTSKILAAGGADVAVTYATGMDDGNNVAEEIRLGGCRCCTFAFDVTAPPSERPAAFPADWRPSDIYYFASPRVILKPGATWDAAQFDRYCAFYVTGLARSITAIDIMFGTARQPLSLFYPSSIFVSEPVPGAAEYAAAKAAGEALCRYLAATRPGLKIEMPRLPRMLTDQTAGMKPSQTQSPLDVMLETLTEGAIDER